MNRTPKIALTFVLALSIICSVSAQKKYWVKFSNKTGTPYSVSNPSAFLTQKSIARRTAFNIPVVDNDLPVNPSYVTQVDNVAGITVIYASKWMNGVVVTASNLNSLALVKALPFVSDTVKVNRYHINNSFPASYKPLESNHQLNRTEASTAFNYGGSYWQNKQINVDCLHNQGFRGTGICIAVMDAGFYGVNTNPYFDSIRNRGRILGTRDFVSGGNNVFDDAQHGMMVLSCMAAIKPGVIMGSAPDADYWLLRSEEGATETISEEYNWIRAAEFADSVGAHILTTSLGYTTFDDPLQNHSYSSLNGKTAPMSIAANLAARKGMFVINSAGNEGSSAWQYISVPADADSVCAVGAIDSLGMIAAFSGKGPTFDGRFKPDLVTRGVGTWICFDDVNVGPGNGTSFSAPVLAGAAACYWQAHRSFSNIDLFKSLRDHASNTASPNNSIGWGIPNMCAIPVGLTELPDNNRAAFSVYPNPFNREIRIELDASVAKPLEMKVTDLSGKTVFYSDMKDFVSGSSIQMPEFSPGFYILNFLTSSGTLSKKLVRHP